ncbi:hypothetical protein CC78DRAFT_524418 [Lojkania enalia]|uniref:DUF6536 domain-containing protein n=1 Tax=Lojkania enalia TaxID=147567 RepID=A0A9P4K561_9PLEO|nr:hypothetical protein CC78DRAFT_524418 [Didymosphaeria enalia]
MPGWYRNQAPEASFPRTENGRYDYQWPTPVDPNLRSRDFISPIIPPDPQRPPAVTPTAYNNNTGYSNGVNNDENAPYGYSRRTTAIPVTRTHSKWKGRIAGYTLLSTIVLAINILATIYVSTRPREGGISAIYIGSCSASSQAVVWIHLAINALSFALTKASNDCQQYLIAPTRSDIDHSHGNGSSLDIGVASWKNFGGAKGGRKFAYILLGLSSIPLAIVYNAAIFSSQFGNSYNYKVMGMEYLSNATSGVAPSYVTDSVPEWALGYETFENLTNGECISAYAKINLHDRDNLILITPYEDYGLYVNPVQGQTGPWQDTNFGSGIPSWMCASSPDDFGNAQAFFYLLDFCPEGIDAETFIESNATNWTLGGYPIAYCLSHKVPEQCQMQGSLLFLTVVILCNVGKILGMLMTVIMRWRDEPLLAIGDVTASFLQAPDMSTAGKCLLTIEDVRKGDQNTWGAKVWNPKRKFWWQAAGGWKFAWNLGLLTSTFVGLIVFLTKAVSILRSNQETSESIWSLTGRTDTFQNTWSLPNTNGYAAHAFVANTPQLLITSLYLLYSNTVSIMAINSEFASYSQVRQPLRTSSPVGQQRKAPLLIPSFGYGVLIIISFTVLHWLLSQSLYLASGKTIRNNYFNPLDNYSDLMGLGFSPLPILISMLLILVLLIALIGSGFRRYPLNAPFVGTNSLAISAACHPQPGDDNAAFSQVMWGATEDGKGEIGVGHCCLTSWPVARPVHGRVYAG